MVLESHNINIYVKFHGAKGESFPRSRAQSCRKSGLTGEQPSHGKVEGKRERRGGGGKDSPHYCAGWFYDNLTQAIVIKKEGASIEKIPW